MCKKLKGLHNRIDPCIRPLIKWLEAQGYFVVASCCGHGKYPMTIVINWNNTHYELFTLRNIPRKRKFYVKDSEGYYYIKECQK